MVLLLAILAIFCCRSVYVSGEVEGRIAANTESGGGEAFFPGPRGINWHLLKESTLYSLPVCYPISYPGLIQSIVIDSRRDQQLLRLFKHILYLYVSLRQPQLISSVHAVRSRHQYPHISLQRPQLWLRLSNRLVRLYKAAPTYISSVTNL